LTATTDEGRGSLAAEIARRVGSIGPAGVADGARTAAQAHLLDCLGMMVAGRRSDRVRRALAADGPRDPVVVLSLACGALGLDDFDEATRTHPGAMIAPALLVAAADAEHPVPGERLMTALVLGYDLIAWFGAALDARGMHPRGRHPSAVLGVPSVALAAAWLLGLDEPGVAAAIGIGAGLSFGLTQFDVREDMRALQTAYAASSGLRAARFAKSGFPASAQALEGPGGLFGGDPARVLPVEAIGAAPSAVEQVSFKPYPHFSDLHPPVTALFSALAGSSVEADEIVAIRVVLTEKAASRLHAGPPHNVKEAKRSARFVLAFALRSITRDGPDLRVPLTEADVCDARTMMLADRIRVAVVPHTPGADAAVASIEVALADGKVLTGTSVSYPGDGRDRRLRWALTDARERFDVIVGGGGERRTGLDAVTRLVDRLRTTDDVRDDARVLINALTTPTGDCDG
jgi:2-methylcitrate dehydratase PrpD